MVVIGDSTSFTDATGPQLPDHPALYPNVLARHLERALDRQVAVTVSAQAGQTVRDATRSVTKDRHLQFDLLRHAEVVVVGVGSFDHAPAGVPPSVEALVPFLRPTTLRRAVRSGLHRAYPWLVRAGAGRRSRTPASEFDRLYALLLTQIRGLTAGRAAGVVIGPTSHRCAYYGHRHPTHRAAEARQLRLAQAHGFASVSSWDHVLPHVAELNGDGIHWPAPAHRALAGALSEVLVPALRGEAPRVGLPGEPPGIVSR